jgi:tetratricopeptide (TPR) repeat protein
LKTSKELDDPARAAKSLFKLGALYQETNRYDDAERYYKKAIGIFGELGDAVSVSTVLGNYALLKGELGDVNGAVCLATQSVVFALKANNMDLARVCVSILRELKEKVPPDEMKVQIREALAALPEDEETLEGYYEAIIKPLELE